MTNSLDFQRLSNYVNGVVDRKLIAITMSLTGSTGYLRSLITQASAYSAEALAHANEARESATEADTSAASSLIAFNEFSSTYLGIAATDPQLSSQGNPVNVGGWYIRQSDGRLRYVTSKNGSGVPSYSDATVAADPNSLAAAGAGVFLSLNSLAQQTVKGPVTFQSTVLGPRVTNWTSQQYATATDVNDRLGTIQQAVTTETSRATAAETALNDNKVSKSGDTMAGALQVTATGINAAVLLRNSTSGSARTYRLHTTDTGVLRIYDDTAGAERLAIAAGGDVTVAGGLSATTFLGSRNLFANSQTTEDAGLTIQRNGVNRWLLRRSDSAGRFYISRFNAQGVFVDTPLFISDTDGSITTNKLTVNDTIFAKTAVTVDGVGASLYLNNTSTAGDAAVHYRHNNVVRWSAGRDPRANRYYINRINDSGTYVDTPFSINESNGWVNVNNLQSNGVIQATTSISAPILYATANATGRAIAIGDDCWIGDNNIPNGFRIGGQSNFSAGFVVFGNSGLTLGCNANDNNLRYGGNIVYHAGNFSVTPDSLGFEHGTTGGVEWSIRPAGAGARYITMSGSMTFTGEYAPQTATYPFALSKVKTFNVATVIAFGNLDYDQMGQFVGTPTNTTVTVVNQEMSGNERYPITMRWTVEGILA